MYMDDRWTAVTGDELTAMIEKINPIGDRYPVTEASTDIGKRRLPFYDNVEFFRVKDPAWEPRNLFIYFLKLGDEFYWLNGTSPPLHQINAAAPIKLTDDYVLSYLVFFTFFVRGEEGPFYVAQSPEDTYVPKKISPDVATVFRNTLRPAIFDGRDEKGNFLCDATIYYSNAIFEAEFRVQPSGMVEMIDDEPIASDLPVKIDAPLS
ncbi:MAG: hypothetical protein AAFY68_03925 [Pseudomonadota bacterium]